MATAERVRLRTWAVRWTKNEEIPEEDMILFLDAAQGMGSAGVASESLGDYSVTRREGGLAAVAKEYLGHHRKVKLR